MKFEITHEKINEHNFLVLRPIETLTDAEYDRLKPSIETMGGHWREKVHGFIFLEDNLMRNEYSQWQEDNQFFPTPATVAKRMVELSGIQEFSYNERPWLLEPSAGNGNLLKQIPQSVWQSEHVVEPVEENVRALNELGHMVEQMTFEKFYDKHKKDKRYITHVLMNPPFSKGRDIKHIKMAYDLMREDGVLVAIIPENTLYYNTDASKEFNKWLKKHDAYIEEVPYGAFKESGTTVDTLIVKVVKKEAR